jgi:hypothetical protein
MFKIYKKEFEKLSDTKKGELDWVFLKDDIKIYTQEEINSVLNYLLILQNTNKINSIKSNPNISPNTKLEKIIELQQSILYLKTDATIVY